MKKQLFAVFAAAFAAAAFAQEPPPPDMTAPDCPTGAAPSAPGMECGMPPMMQPPPAMMGPGMVPDGEWKRAAMEREQRRGEIMILVRAYKIMPESGRAAIKTELEKRIREDYLTHRQRAEQMIAKMEERIAKMKAALSDEKTDEMVQREFDKLMKLPMLPPAGMMPGMRNEKNGDRPNRNERRGDVPERKARNAAPRRMNGAPMAPAGQLPPAPEPKDAAAQAAPDGEPVPPPEPEEME